MSVETGDVTLTSASGCWAFVTVCKMNEFKKL